MEKQTNKKALARYLSPIDVWSMAFGCMVGWGAFVMPGTTFLPVAGPAGTIIAMLLGTVVMLIIGYNFAYLMNRNSRTGGVYSYTKEAFGRDHAFLSSWFLCLSYLTIVFLNGTALFLVIRTILGDVYRSGYHYTVAGNEIYLSEVAFSVLSLAGVGILFVFAKAALQYIHTILSVMLLAGVVFTAAFCIPHAVSNGVIGSFGTNGSNNAYVVFSLVILSPWAFVGFDVASFETAHFKFPLKKSKPVIFLAILAAGAAYIVMTIVSVSSVPDGFSSWQEYISNLDGLSGLSSVPTFNAAYSIMGSLGLRVISITALAAILTGLIGGYRATTRVLSTMAEDRILSDKFSKTTYSILFIMIISIILALFGRNTLNWFVDLTAFGAIVGFGYTSAAAWKIAKTENNKHVMVTAAAGTFISALFAIVQMVPRLTALETMGSEAFFLLAMWCLLGFVFYWRTVKSSTLTEYSGISASGTVLFALLMYSSIMWLAKLLVSKGSVEEVRSSIVWGGFILLLIIFIGLVVMLYVQNQMRKKHEAVEREKIRAVEGSIAKSQFLFNMSHDIRTPMNAIIGYTTLALKEPSPDNIKDYLKKIDLSSRHLLNLINDILEMSRIENGQIELQLVPCDLCRIFADVKTLFSQQMKEKEMNFSVHTSQVHNRYVWCDEKNFNRVLLNLLSNAYKFTPKNGEVKASLWEIGNGENGYGTYEIRIQDNGIGMSKEFAEKMFTTFERERTSTNSGIEGTGLGLAITKRIIDLMGGTIDVLTSPGSGTEAIIRVKFKLASAESIYSEDEKAKADTETSEIDFTKYRLLIVEDNAINMEIAKMILSKAGFMIETAENGKLTLDMVAASTPGYYDIVLMDIQMPVMDGYETTKAIRSLENKELAKTPIVAMTANAFIEDVKAAKKAGMQAHIAKPINVNALMNTLKDILINKEQYTL